MNMKTEKDNLMQQTIADCRMLYCMAKRPLSESCMPFLWECGYGWHQKLHEMSCKLELLNIMLYPEYKVRVQMDQVKEKYGTLRAYFSVVCDNYNVIGKLGNMLTRLSDTLRTVNYGYKTVVDKESYSTNETEELTAEQYKRFKAYCYGDKLREENGKFYRDYELWHPAKTHVEICKHKILHKLMNMLDAAGRKLKQIGFNDFTPAQRIVMTYLDNAAEKIVNDAEAECYNVCEHCGHQIGTDWSPRCETTGWITYICDECAAKQKGFYYKNGAKWQGNKLVMTKEEVDAEHKKAEDKLKEKYGDKDNEDKK